MNKKPPILAIYYPGWTKGREFNEWDLLKKTKSTLQKYHSKNIPELGFYDCAEHHTVRNQIIQAKSFGISGFLICWYWDNGFIHLEKTLDTFRSVISEFQGFYYALIWVNRRPHKRLPLDPPVPSLQVYDVFRDRIVRTNTSDLKKLAKYCFNGPFLDDAYLKINGKPVLAIFSVKDLLPFLQSNNRKSLDGLRSEVTDIHLVGIIHGLEDWLEDAKNIGFDSLMSYVLLPDWLGPPLQDYLRYSKRAELLWPILSRLSGLRYSPSVCAGWDASPRGKFIPENTPKHYPWQPIIIKVTTESFKRHFYTATHFANENDSPFIVIASWNEWTEGHAIEPKKNGNNEKLKVIREYL